MSVTAEQEASTDSSSLDTAPPALVETDPPEPVDVVFIIPPCWGVDAPPSGASYVSGYLQDQGYKVQLRDINVELYHHLGSDYEHLWKQESYRIWELAGPFYESILPKFDKWLEEVVESIAVFKPKVACLSINVASVIFAVHFAQLLKQRIPGLRTIFGGNQCRFGVGASHLPPGLFGPSLRLMGLVDAVVLGEGEQVAHELVMRIMAGQPLVNVPGAITIDDGFYGNFLHKPENPDLDALGHPNFEGYPLDLYREQHLPMLLSRGCRFRCAFCNERMQFEGFRSRSGDKVFEEVALHQDRYGTELFHFCDLVINGAPQELLQFARRVAESGRNIYWSSQAVIHKALLDDELVSFLAKGGADHFIYGVESFSEKVMKLMGKPYPAQLVDEVLKNCAKNGLGSVINIIVGFPGETEKELEETVEGLKRNAPYINMVSSVGECLVPPGSILEQRFKEYGLTFPEEDRFIHWSMPDNTHDIRLERLQRILDVLAELGLGYYKTTRYDEALQENLDEKQEPRFMPEVMSLSPGPDRSTASYSFVSSTVEEPAGPSLNGTADAAVGDPGWVFSPITPMPKPYMLLEGQYSQVRLGGRSMDFFYRKHLISRGPGLLVRLIFDDGRVLKSDGGFWSYVHQEDRVLAFCDWGDPAVQLCFRVGQEIDDCYQVETSLQFQEPGGVAEIQIGVDLYDQIDQIWLEGQPSKPVMPYSLPAGALVDFVPTETGSLPRVSLDLALLGEGWVLEHEGDIWIEENRYMFRRQIPCEDTLFKFLIKITDPSPDEDEEEATEDDTGVGREEEAAEANAGEGKEAGESEDEEGASLEAMMSEQWRREEIQKFKEEEESKDLSLCKVRTLLVLDDTPPLDYLYIPPRSVFAIQYLIYCRKHVPEPLFRVQIHAAIPGQEGLLLVGTNNYRTGTHIPVQEGCFTRGELRIEELNLAPGSYQMSISLLSDESPTATTYDISECAFELEVTGERGTMVTYLAQEPLVIQPLATPSRSDQKPEETSEHDPDHLQVEEIYPPENPDAVCTTLRPGDPLEAVVELSGDRKEDSQLEIQLCRFNRVLALWKERLPEEQSSAFKLRLDCVNLLKGDYQLTVLPQGRPYAGDAMTVHVKSKRSQGGGVIYCPCSGWSELMPRPPFNSTTSDVD